MSDLNNILREARASDGVRQLRAELADKLDAAKPSNPVRTYAVSSDFSNMATSMSVILSATQAVAEAIVKEAGALAPNDIDTSGMLRTIEAVFHDLHGDLEPPLTAIAKKLANENYGGVSTRGPFLKHRSV